MAASWGLTLELETGVSKGTAALAVGLPFSGGCAGAGIGSVGLPAFAERLLLHNENKTQVRSSQLSLRPVHPPSTSRAVTTSYLKKEQAWKGGHQWLRPLTFQQAAWRAWGC